MVLYILQRRTFGSENKYFSNIPNIVDYLQAENICGYHTVVAMDIDTNVRHAVFIKDHPPCNTFEINKMGEMRPLNVHKINR